MRRGTLGGMSNSAASLIAQSNIESQTAGSFLSSCILLMVTFDKKIVNTTVLLKMYSVTRAMMNSNLSMAARCIPTLSSSSSCRLSRAWTTTGNAFLKVYNAPALLYHLSCSEL